MKPAVTALVLAAAALPAAAQGTGAGTVVYRCPGPPVLYTDALSAKEAQERGCRTIEGAPVTIVQGNRPRTSPGTPAPMAPVASRGSDAKVDPAAQRQRDSDARRILEAELQREQDKLAALRSEYNNGQPERRGDERNYEKYLERVAEMKAGIERKESDVAAIKRELSKLPAP